MKGKPHIRLALSALCCLALLAGLNLLLLSLGHGAQGPSLTLLIANLIGVAVLGAFFMAVIRNSVLSPLERLAEYASKAAQGDLNASPNSPIDTTFSGSLHTLKASIDALIDALHREMRSAREYSAQADRQADEARQALDQANKAGTRDAARRRGLLSAAQDLERISKIIDQASHTLESEAEQVNGGAQQQKDLVAGMAGTLEQVMSSMGDVAESASRASEAAGHALGKANHGEKVVRDSIQAIALVSERASRLKEQMGELGTQVNSIGEVMNVISDIADQTNLLALNAAIEAARAGDAGRGFAVVADEVRKLAEKTIHASKNVGSVIKAIEQGTQINLRNVEEANEAVASATELARDSGRSLEEIVALVETNSQQVGNIALASRQQADAGQGLKRDMDEVLSFSQETAHGMNRSLETVHSMGSEIEGLVKLTGLFTIIGEGKAQETVERLAANEAMRAMNPGPMEQIMRAAITKHAFLELLYVTDSRGVQVSENIASRNFTTLESGSVKGKNWSSRPWYTGAMGNGDTFVSPLYKSEASEGYCLTISTPIFGRDNTIIGILAADVRVFA